MSILFAGSSIADFAIDNTPVAVTTAANIAPYVKEGMGLGGTTAKTATCSLNAVSDLWVGWHHRALSTTSGTTVNVIEFFSSAYSTVNALFRIRRPSESTWRLEYFNGSSWVTTEATFGGGPGSDTMLRRFDVRLKLSDTAGVFQLYKDGALIASFSSTDTIYTSGTTIDMIRFYAGGYISSTTDANVSGVIVADEDTRNMTLTQLLPTGAGATSGWTGTYADVDETGYVDTDYIESLTADQVSTFAFEDMPSAVSTHTVEAVVVAGRGRVGSSAPTVTNAVTRVGGSDFTAAPRAPLTTSYAPFQSVIPLNPSTGGQWTQSQINAAEFGVKSLT